MADVEGTAGGERRLRRALLSVSDKSGVVEFATTLVAHDIELVSTGGTAQALRDAGLPVREVADLTGFPEIMGGRVKTLHPMIHGGLLGRDCDAEVMADLGIAPIDLAVINLYPFSEAVADPNCSLAAAIEQVDIGGPAMVRSAAKNFERVAICTDRRQYTDLAAKLDSHAATLDRADRFELARAAFDAVARYDGVISDYFSSLSADGERLAFPGQFNPAFRRVSELRYGENPHQQAALYRLHGAPLASLVDCVQRSGKPLSFNNFADADAAWNCLRELGDGAACVIVKHGTPCGVAVTDDPATAYAKAYATDPESAFGGIIAFNQPVKAELITAILDQQFVEVIAAPKFSDAALDAARAKPNVRLIELPVAAPGAGFVMRQIDGGLLLQTADIAGIERSALEVRTARFPTASELEDLLFAWRVAKHVKSNAIVMARDGRTVGIGGGQPSRVMSARIAVLKATAAGFETEGAVLASDAFFPFRDGVDAAATAGVRAIIQPGGSMRDAEVIAACDEHDIAMAFTGIRHFRH